MITTMEAIRRGSVALAWIGSAAIVYRFLLRQPILDWGATNAEARARLPGDELLEEADGVATRAITIDAPASAVWPWIAQMGPVPRGGAYTYDWIENLLGLDMHSSDRVLPEYQHPQVGDTLGYGKNRMRFERVEPERVLSTRSEDGNWVWSFVLDELNGRTRLISRNRFRLPSMTARIGMVPMEPAIADHGAKDAARHQAARRAPRVRDKGGNTCLSRGRHSRPTTLASRANRSGSTGRRRRSTSSSSASG